MTGDRADRADAAPGVPVGDATGRAWNARAVLPADERAPLTARRLVSTLLLAWGFPESVELAELVASEIASNAVRYAGTAGDLDLELSASEEDVIRLSIADGSPELPVLRPDRSGLGLRLVERVAADWGVDDHMLGKRVWVHLPAQPSTPGTSDRIPRFAGTTEGNGRDLAPS